MIGQIITREFRISNYIEAGLWISIAAGFVFAALKYGGVIRRRCWIAAVVFLLFGLSDLVEAGTGAWYRPIWLLLWKGGCLVVMGWLLFVYFRERRAMK
jgi:hypothetical protein